MDSYAILKEKKGRYASGRKDLSGPPGRRF
jgi:hypothetical protein